MGTFKLKIFTLASFRLLFFTIFTCNLTATSAQMTFNPLKGEICNWVSCGQGTCQATDVFPGFQCNCSPGWTKFKIADFELPSCVLPNCTVSLQCGNGAPPPPPPPPPPPFNLNFSDPCMLVWCVDGTCERNGAEFRCQCTEGSANLMNNPKFPCFKKCSLGGDCHGLDLGFGSVNEQPPPPSPQGNFTSSATGSGEMLNCSSHFHMLIMILSATFFVFLRWI